MTFFSAFANSLQKAKFKGIEFVVSEARRISGRKVVAHSYWGRDEPWIEDMGKATSIIQIRGFLMGDDVYAQRKKLEAQVNAAGSGELIHPSYGSLNCTLMSFSSSESVHEGRIIELEMTFIPTSDKSYPQPTGFTASVLKSISNALGLNDSAASDFFGKVGDTIAEGQRQVNAVLGPVQKFMSQTQGMMHDATRALHITSGLGAVSGSGITFGRYNAGNLSGLNKGFAAVTGGITSVRQLQTGVNQAVGYATATRNNIDSFASSVSNLGSFL